VWCDTMVSVPPFLVKMSQVTTNTIYFDEAVTQVLKHANRLQDPATGLYHHAWSASQSSYIGPAYWSRGNGWVLLGDVAVLSAMTDTHPSRTTLLNIFRAQAAALKPLQHSSGLWPNVVNHADYYLETSGTALIGDAFRQGVAAGWLDSYQYAAPAEAARLGVWRKVLADGMMTDVMVPTGPKASDAVYNTLPHSDLQLFGQGVALLVASP
jgi:unsaturated rhamnogalacturonyl hydrolase